MVLDDRSVAAATAAELRCIARRLDDLGAALASSGEQHIRELQDLDLAYQELEVLAKLLEASTMDRPGVLAHLGLEQTQRRLAHRLREA